MEFLRVASGEAATPLAVLQGDDESLSPRARALARLAATLTKEPWALTRDLVENVARQGLDAAQIEAAVGVVAMFNYFTRVADATGIEFDYQTPLPAFEPDLRQVTAPRPVSPPQDTVPRRQPGHRQLLEAWGSWRAYVLESDKPLSPRERRLLASVASEETGAGPFESPEAGDEHLVRFARKLSRQPWCMEADDLDKLRASGYPEEALLHVISVVAHQNADSRLAIGLNAVSPT